MVLSTATVNPAVSQASTGNLSGNNAAPETGEFDFMSYFLGLQAAPQPEFPNQDPTAVPTRGEKTEELADDPLLSLFKTKKEDSWSPMLPNVAPTELKFNSPVAVVDESSGPTQAPEPTTFVSLPADAPLITKGSTEGTEASKFRSEQTEVIVDPTQRDLALQKYAANIKPTTNSSPGANVSVTEETKPVTFLQKANLSPAESTIASTNSEIPALQKGGEVELPLEVTGRKRPALSGERSTDGSDAINLIATKPHGATATTASATAAKPADAQPMNVPELFNRVESMVHHGGGKMNVLLTPPELGQMEIQVITKGNKVEIAMKSESNHAKSILESHLGDLKHSLQAHDLVLSKMEIHVSRELSPSFNERQFGDLANAGGNAFQQSQNSAQNNGREGGRFYPPNNSSSTIMGAIPPIASHSRNVATHPGRVDMRI